MELVRLWCITAAVGPVRLWRNLCASGGTCPPLADRLTNNQSNHTYAPLAQYRISYPELIFKFNSSGVDNFYILFFY